MVKTFLALGDSYTIGEQVLLTESFPYQTIQMLRKQGFNISAPEIIAKTGWTTAELMAELSTLQLMPTYDYVSLLIGVNNQYRGLKQEDLMQEFKYLLDFSIQHSDHKPGQVFVLSVPDWGMTPFAEGKDRKRVTSEIDSINAAYEKIVVEKGCNFISISDSYRADIEKAGFLTEDKLHPSALEYKKWATRLSDAIQKMRS